MNNSDSGSDQVIEKPLQTNEVHNDSEIKTAEIAEQTAEKEYKGPFGFLATLFKKD